jgi:16S rRNA C967 or C1407 C5-methylase (RsmB/RsmF family)/NOL1/NOP2/fmu family ribosome biogenesis protein
MNLPSDFLNSIEVAPGFERKSFIDAHESGDQITSIRINPSKFKNEEISFREIQTELVPWSKHGYYLSSRPSFTFDPLFHAGCYYVQEASSMFLEQALSQTVDLSKDMRILDLSAAPGGKSTHLQSLITEGSLLVSNDVIRSRANVLKDNIIKWGAENVVVTNNDPRDFSTLDDFFDVVVIDAPCSGSGLFRRDPAAIAEWSLNNVALCSQRQQRILADILPALKNNGILIYSTCSYSVEEDEEIIDWLTSTREYEPLPLRIEEEWNIISTTSSLGAYGYRFWPGKSKGEGFFIACLQKKSGSDFTGASTKKLMVASKKDIDMAAQWMNGSGKKFIKHENTLYAWPEIHVEEMNILLNNLRVIYSGVKAGELMRDKLVPDHALALCGLVNDSIPRCELELEDSIKYLQRKEFQVETIRKGWQLVNYHGHSLGWMNVLSNRINNYYPKELRILKDI